MKRIKLTKGYYAKVDNADFEWLNQWKWYADISGKYVYASRYERIAPKKQRKIRMHRQILGLTDPKVLGDHKDLDTLNNQRHNLRPVNKAQNRMNSFSSRNSSSKYKGVSWHKTLHMWLSHIYVKKRLIYLGYFKSESKAAKAYNEAAVKHFGEFANLNKVK